MAQERSTRSEYSAGDRDSEEVDSGESTTGNGQSNSAQAARAAAVRAERRRDGEPETENENEDENERPPGLRIGGYHFTEAGDTWWKLAEELLGDGRYWAAFAQRNPMVNGAVGPHQELPAGELVNVPITLTPLPSGGLMDNGFLHQEHHVSLNLPSLGGAKPEGSSFWQDALHKALNDSMRSFAGSQGGGIDEFKDALSGAGKAAAESFLRSALDEVQDELFPGGLNLRSGWEFAQEHPIPTALLGVGAAIGAKYYLDSKPKLTLRVGALGLDYDTATGEYAVSLRYKWEF